MAGQNAAEILIAPHGNLLTAPLGSPIPTDVSSAWDPAWIDLGFADENGVKLTPNLTTAAIRAWQSAADVKRVVTGVEMTLEFSMIQFNANTTSLYFFGTSWSAPVGGVSTLTISSQVSISEKMLGVQWDDGSGNVQRLIIPRGTVSKMNAVSLARKDAFVSGVTFDALDSSGTLCYLLSNDSAV